MPDADLLYAAFPSPAILAALSAATFAGGALRGMSGFGAALMLAPVFTLFMTPAESLMVILLLNIATTTQILREAMRLVEWRTVWALFLPALVGIPAGFALLHVIDPTVMRRMVAGVVTALALVLLSGWRYSGPRGALPMALVGVVSGVLTGSAGIGGPPVILYLLSGGMPLAVARAVLIIFFALSNIAGFVPFLVEGSVSSGDLVRAGALLPIYILATWAGSVAFRMGMRAHEDGVRRFCLLLLFAVGAMSFLL
ncbi:hypothetical protein VY88_20235 [Azospirillum thiophilum]|uniref:Probable membrane transporter protein n=1 Tax=Azospirillum thiophilum TaxID=528244 RepID=A0AAC9EYC6_9PROT|nr:sulfite exporter TauE/SafE family protein [Azospirillum thiophilum]ALG74349.1 hypothetical protein AL072_25735 [Azospirillum thiophilum]KJR63783.1 hypothetical protein VY88_20235 [Azospirillum thiophilum]